MNIEELRKRCSDGEKFEYLFFWGHQKPKDGNITKSCLSQWYPSPFTVENIVYPTAEHWMMASKARFFNDKETLEKILVNPDPKAAKALGRSVKNFDDAEWTKNAIRFVLTGNLGKFNQNEELKNFLISTKQSVIVEASPYDRIWGIGLKAEDERANNPANWQGQNLLGFILMHVRSFLSIET